MRVSQAVMGLDGNTLASATRLHRQQLPYLHTSIRSIFQIITTSSTEIYVFGTADALRLNPIARPSLFLINISRHGVSKCPSVHVLLNLLGKVSR